MRNSWSYILGSHYYQLWLDIYDLKGRLIVEQIVAGNSTKRLVPISKRCHLKIEDNKILQVLYA